MKLLVLGAGMYVTGRGGLGNPTVLASLAQLSKEVPISRVLVAARNPGNAMSVEQTTGRLNALLSTHLDVAYVPLAGDDLESEVASLCATEAFDGAIVAIPDPLHAAPVRALLRAGVASLVVKPFVPTLTEARDLVHCSSDTVSTVPWSSTNASTRAICMRKH